MAVLMVTACSGDPGSDPDGVEPEQVPTQPASEEQLAILEDGEVTFEEYAVAVGRSLSCMEAAGITVEGPTKTDERGFTELRYSHNASSPGRTDDETLAVADACLHEHSMVVEMMYQTSDHAVEAQDALFEEKRDALVACLEDNGSEIDPDASRNEVTLAAVHLFVDGGADCLTEAGL